jgi:hypothetical protein
MILATSMNLAALAVMESEDFVLNQMAKKFPPDQGVSRLPLEARKHFNRIAMYYADLGILSVLDESQATVIVAAMHGPALRTWRALEPYIRAERAARHSTKYLSFFEHLACVCTDIDLVEMHENLGLRTFAEPADRTAVHPGPSPQRARQEEINPST